MVIWMYFFGGAVVVFFLRSWCVGSRAYDFVRFNGMRGVQIELIPSSILLALGVPVRVVYQSGALEVESAATSLVAGLSPLLVEVAALCATAGYALSRARSGQRSSEPAGSRDEPTRLLAASDPEGFVAATLLILLLTIVFSKVLSPQYLLWILPIVPLLVVGHLHGRLFQVGFLVACFLSTLIYPVLYLREFERVDPAGGYLIPGTLGVAILVLRNGILIVLALLLVRPVVRLGRTQSPGAEVSTIATTA